MLKVIMRLLFIISFYQGRAATVDIPELSSNVSRHLRRLAMAPIRKYLSTRSTYNVQVDMVLHYILLFPEATRTAYREHFTQLGDPSPIARRERGLAHVRLLYE